MKSTALTNLTGFCLALCLMATSAHAQPAAGPAKADRVAQAVLVDQLAAYAELKQEPMAHLLAARMLHELRPVDAASGVADTSGTTTLLARARAMPTATPEVLTMADKLEASFKRRTRGTKSGLKFSESTIATGKDLAFNLTFKADEPATVGLVLNLGSESSYSRRQDIELDLLVLDEERRTVCEQRGPGVPETCRWTPRKEGAYLIRVENRGSVDASFRLNFEER